MQLTLFSKIAGLSLVTCVSAIVSGLTLLARGTGILEPVELAHYDFATSQAASSDLTPDVAIVAVRDNELAKWGWPISDEQLAQLIHAALGAGAKVVGVDILRERPVEPGAAKLEAVLKNPRVTTIGKLGNAGDFVITPPDVSLKRGSFGFADVPVDRDGVARRSLLLVNDGQTLKYSFSLQLAFSALGIAELTPWPDNPQVLKLGNIPVPPLNSDFGSYARLDASGYQIMAHFAQRLPVAPMLSARELLEGETDLGGKVVLIGLISDSIKDHFVTPLNRNSGTQYVYGLQVHAALVQQLIDHVQNGLRPITDLPHWIQGFMVVAASVLASGIVVLFRNPVLAILLGGAGALGLLGGMTFSLNWHLWLPAVPVTAAWITAFVLTFIFVASRARQQRRVMSQLFESQLSPELAQEIWNQRASILSKGETIPRRLQVSLLFADVVGATTVGGKAEPDAYLAWIGTLLDALSEDAACHGGFVEKFTGDGILVAFGAPLARESGKELTDDARAACACALKMRETVARLNSADGVRWPYAMRIGLHSGLVFGGTIGRKGSMRYNLVGDAVNVAARIEAYAKTLEGRQIQPVTICCSEEFMLLLDGFAECSPAGTLLHDDKTTTHRIYTIAGLIR